MTEHDKSGWKTEAALCWCLSEQEFCDGMGLTPKIHMLEASSPSDGPDRWPDLKVVQL